MKHDLTTETINHFADYFQLVFISHNNALLLVSVFNRNLPLPISELLQAIVQSLTIYGTFVFVHLSLWLFLNNAQAVFKNVWKATYVQPLHKSDKKSFRIIYGFIATL